MRWTKGFSASEVVGENISEILYSSLSKKGISVNISALIDDTVGTLLTGCYSHVDAFCFCGVIVGTGSNCCYIERISNIPKLSNLELTEKPEFMVLNLESGNFGSRIEHIGIDLPMSEFDHELDKNSQNKNQQLFEKQISGMYLGEISRLVIKKFMKNGIIFRNFPDKLENLYSFSTIDMSKIEADNSHDLSTVEIVLSTHGINTSSLEERKFVKSITHIIALRASQLVAVQIAAIFHQVQSSSSFKYKILQVPKMVVAIDGSVYEKFPGFSESLLETLDSLIGTKKVQLELVKDGSGIGAAVASLVNSTN